MTLSGGHRAAQRPTWTDPRFEFSCAAILAPRPAGHLMGGQQTEQRILKAGEISPQECWPIDDVRGSAVYRRRVVCGLLVRGLWPHGETGARLVASGAAGVCP